MAQLRQSKTATRRSREERTLEIRRSDGAIRRSDRAIRRTDEEHLHLRLAPGRLVLLHRFRFNHLVSSGDESGHSTFH